jgi:hypothetical protein
VKTQEFRPTRKEWAFLLLSECKSEGAEGNGDDHFHEAAFDARRD